MLNPRDVTGASGLYVHIPFCSHRCWYCDFNAYAGLDDIVEDYMKALLVDIEQAHSAGQATMDPRPELTSIFIGGGTPTLVDASWIARVLDRVRDSWPMAQGAEVTIECNPESTTPDKLAAYRRAGINRISVGVQALQPHLLQTLGRTHDPATALRALRDARAAGFERLSGDLIVGIPGQTMADVNQSLEGVLSAGATHISCYALTYEEGTPLHAWRRLGKIDPQATDDVADALDLAHAKLSTAGLSRYEISNWTASGICLHNDTYWMFGEYLGVGAGAHSHLAHSVDTRRSWNLRSPKRYAEAVVHGEPTVAGYEDVDRCQRAAEVMFLGLRRTAGVGRTAFARLLGSPIEEWFADELERGVSLGLLAVGTEAVTLTQRGLDVADGVAQWFLSPDEPQERAATTRAPDLTGAR